MVTAILHDTIEDTTLTAEMIAKIFNEIVAGNVEDLTRLKYAIKITAFDTVNLLFAQYKFTVLYIKLFDRLHNMRTIGAMSLEKQEKITNETKACFIPLAYRLKNYAVKAELMKLCRETLLSVESKRRNHQ